MQKIMFNDAVSLTDATLRGKKPYKDVYSEIVKMEVEIVEDEDGDLDWKELSKVYI
ncbi:MAG: hypothetical protein K2L50_00670 [Bacteroidales bacterium]|nr:hypothetical protein [Bacteroidales bacterium]